MREADNPCVRKKNQSPVFAWAHNRQTYRQFLLQKPLKTTKTWDSKFFNLTVYLNWVKSDPPYFFFTPPRLSFTFNDNIPNDVECTKKNTQHKKITYIFFSNL